MFFQSAAIVLVLIGSASADPKIEQITHENNDQLVSTGPSNYGLSSSLLSSFNWKTLTVNGKEVVLFRRDSCLPNLVSFDSFSAEQLKEIQKAKERLLFQRWDFIDVTYQPNGHSLSSRGPGIGAVKMLSILGEFRLNKYTNSVYSVKYITPTNGLDRLVFAGHIVTFVYESSEVQMKPIDCLESEEKRLVEKIQSAVKQYD